MLKGPKPCTAAARCPISFSAPQQFPTSLEATLTHSFPDIQPVRKPRADSPAVHFPTPPSPVRVALTWTTSFLPVSALPPCGQSPALHQAFLEPRPAPPLCPGALSCYTSSFSTRDYPLAPPVQKPCFLQEHREACSRQGGLQTWVVHARLCHLTQKCEVFMHHCILMCAVLCACACMCGVFVSICMCLCVHVVRACVCERENVCEHVFVYVCTCVCVREIVCVYVHVVCACV